MNNREYIALIKGMDCCACGRTGPSDAHHIREGQGAAQRADDHLAIPLCKTCHQDGTKAYAPSVHKAPLAFRMKYGDEMSLLAKTLREVHRAL